MPVQRLRFALRAKFLVGLLALAVILTPHMATADVFTYALLDHPDGNQSRPGYGLRVDGLGFFVDEILLGNTSSFDDDEVWSFSFDADGAKMTASLDTDAMTLTFYGTAVGGRDTDQDPAGPSMVDIWFQYDYDAGDIVESSPPDPFFNGHPLVVLEQDSLSDPVGTGTLTFLDGASAADGVPIGTVVNMVSYGKNDGIGEIMTFKADEHRLNDLDPALGFTDCDGGNPHPGCDFPVPFGWVGLIPGDPNLHTYDKYDVFHEGSQDWLATTPEPAVLPLMGISLLALTWLGRRRAE